MVDLESEAVIYEVKIFNRLDTCCSKWLDHFTLMILDADDKTVASEYFSTNDGVSEIFSSKVFNFEKVKGRKVKILKDGIINLAEVEVDGKWAPPSPSPTSSPQRYQPSTLPSTSLSPSLTPSISASPTISSVPTQLINLALKKPAMQDSVCSNGNAERAVDGNTNGYWNGGSVTHTCKGTNRYWIVDLEDDAVISEIKIYNRLDTCCKNNLDHFTLEIIDADGEIVDSKYFSTKDGVSTIFSTKVFKFVKAKGRKVQIRRVLNGFIQLAEVEVVGHWVPESSSPTLSPTSSPQKTQSVLPSLVPSLGLSLEPSGGPSLSISHNPSSLPSETHSSLPSLVPSSLSLAPSGSPSVDLSTDLPTQNVCLGLPKNKCNKKADQCIFTKKKMVKQCVAKDGQFESDCSQTTSKPLCLAKDWCKYRNDSGCSHTCIDTKKNICKTIKVSKKKICKWAKKSNPCFKCHPVSKCT